MKLNLYLLLGLTALNASADTANCGNAGDQSFFLRFGGPDIQYVETRAAIEVDGEALPAGRYANWENVNGKLGYLYQSGALIGVELVNSAEARLVIYALDSADGPEAVYEFDAKCYGDPLPIGY